MKLIKFNHATPVSSDTRLTALFFDKTLALKNSFTKPNPDQMNTSIEAIGNDSQPDFLRYIVSDEASHGFVGKGNVHHIAMAVEEDEDQLKIMNRLNNLGIHNSGIIDRFWFNSLYFRDPDGNLLEIATKKPGYAADEAPDKLGTSLILPPWVEPQRKEIEKVLREDGWQEPRSMAADNIQESKRHRKPCDGRTSYGTDCRKLERRAKFE